MEQEDPVLGNPAAESVRVWAESHVASASCSMSCVSSTNTHPIDVLHSAVAVPVLASILATTSIACLGRRSHQQRVTFVVVFASAISAS